VNARSTSSTLAFRHTPVPTLIADLDYDGGARVIEANDALQHLLGHDDAPLADLPLKQLTTHLGDAADRDRLLAAADAGSEIRTPVVGAGGRRLAACVSLLPEGPGRLAVLCLMPDGRLDTETALRSSSGPLQDMADNVAALVYLKGMDGEYLFTNRHYERLTGLGRDEIRGKNDFDVWPEQIAQAYRADDCAVLEAGVPMEFEEPIPIDDHTCGMWLSLKFPLFDADGTVYGVGGISTDISDRNRAELVVRAAKDEAERANRAKSQFLSRMSHELRTPLNSVLGFGQLLQLEPLPASAARAAERIVGAGRHLLALVDEVLDISSIESGMPVTAARPVHAALCLQEALELIRPLAEARGIELVADLHGALYRFVLADPQRLTQVLLNVLSNGVKYNRPEGVVTVTAQTLGPRLRFRVADTGQGIRPADVHRLFLPFERLGAERTGVEGTGLGLALSRSLLESMGGTIGVERSVPGRGSIFFVELTQVEQPEGDDDLLMSPRPVPRVREDLGDLTVLYVEDDPTNVELVRQILALAGGPVLLTTDQGAQAVELVARHRPDVVLLDLHLPDLDGEQVLLRLGADARTRWVPVVVLSADATANTGKRMQAAGASRQLTKPIDVTLLLDTLATVAGVVPE